MANTAKNEPLNLDEYDFGNEFDFEEFSLEPKPPKNKREAVERIAEGAWEGAKDTVRSPSFFREFIKRALPRGFGDMVDLADQSATSVRDLYNEGFKESKPMLRDVGRVIDKMMPSASKYLPKPAEKVLKTIADKVRDEPQSGIGAGNMNDMAVMAMMGETFKYGAKESARLEAKNDARETIRDSVNNDRHNDNYAQLDGIRRGVVSMAAYQRRIEFNYQKKSLELQARQYFVSVDSLNEMKRNNLRTSEMLAGIMHNTSIPDLIKLKTTEKFKLMLRDKAMAGLQDGIFGNRSNFFQNLGKAFRDQALGSLRNFAGGVQDTIGMGEMVADQAQMAQEMGMDRFRMAGNTVGSLATSWGGKFAASKIGKKIMGDNGKHAKGVRNLGNRLRFFSENAPQIATDWSHRYTDTEDSAREALNKTRLPDGLKDMLSRMSGIVGNPIMDLLKGTVRRANGMDSQVKDRGLADQFAPATFNNQAHTSIVSIIPGLLARILQEAQITRTGDTSVDLIQYDFSTGKFTSTKTLRNAVFGRLFDDNAKRGVKQEKDHLLEMIDPRGVLNPEQRKELSNILMNDNLRGRAGYETGRISNYQNAGNFGESKHGEKYAGLFRDLQQKNQAQENDLGYQFAHRFSRVGRSMNDRRADIQQLLEIYPRETLEDMGLLKPGSSDIDMAKVNAYFSGEQYNAKGITAMPGMRQLSSNRSRRVLRSNNRHVDMPAANDGVAAEIQKLIEVIETQNTKPLVSDIKDILNVMQEELRSHGGGGASSIDRVIDGAGNAFNAAGRTARRLNRQAQVKGRRFLNGRQQQIDDVRQRAAKMADEAKRRAKRAQRRLSVDAMRLKQRYQPQIDSATQHMHEQMQHVQDRAQGLWNERPTMEQLRDMLTHRWDQARGYAAGTYEYLQSDTFRDQLRRKHHQAKVKARGVGENLMGRFSDINARASDMLKQIPEGVRGMKNQGVLGEIKDILTAIRDRLEDGIITTGGLPSEGVLRRIGGAAKRAGGATKRGLSRLNMSMFDLIKGGVGTAFGAARLGGKVTNALVGGGFRLGWGAVKGTAGLVGDGIGFATSSQYRRARGFVDIYVGDERKPRMYGRMLQEGNVYFDKASGKPIRRLKDISGVVVRKTEKGEEVVMEADEIQYAWQKVGPVKKMLKALGAGAKGVYGIGKTILGIAGGGIPPVFKMALWGAKKAWSLLDMAQDIFVKDRLSEPAMTAKLMRAGSYYSATSYKVIKRPSQIDGPVLIGEGDQAETVLTHDDIRKGLVDKNNKPIRTGLSKLLNFAFGGIRRGFGLAIRAGKLVNAAATGLVTNGLKLGRAAIKGAVSLTGGTLDVLRGRNPFRQGPSAEITKKAVALQTESVNYLKEIRDLLKDRLPERKKHSDQDVDGDGIRDGSYEDQMKHKAEAEKAKAEKASAGGSVQGKPGVGARMKAGALSLWDRLRGKKEGDESGDTNISVGGEGGPKRRGPKGGWKNAKGWKGKAKFLGSKGWGAMKGLGKIGLGLVGLEGIGLGGALSGAGGVLASGAAVAAEGLMAAGAAVAGVLTAPVLLGAAAVAAIGVGGYYGYKYLTRKKLGLLSRIRYTQYGFAPTDKDHVNAVFGLEDKLKDAVIYSKEGAKLDAKRVDTKTLFKDFDIDEKDVNQVNSWIQWFGNRFKPVFLTHVTALKGVAGDKWLGDVDDLDPAIGLTYLNQVRFPDGPYFDSTSPFKDLKSLPSGRGDVKAIIEIAETELKKKAPGGKAAAVGVTAAAATAGVAAVATTATKTNASASPGTGISAKALSAASTNPASPAKGAQIIAAGSSVLLQNLNSDKLDGLDVVRFKSYGLVKMEIDKVRSLQALEKYITQKLSFNKNVATWSGSIEQVVLDNGAAFGVDSSNDELTANWISWFNQRFLPVFLNYASLIKAQTDKDDPVDGKLVLKPNQAVDVATALFTTNSGSSSVWNVSVSPWRGYDLNMDVRSTDGNVQGLKDLAKTVVLAEPGGKAANQPTASKSAANAQVSAAAPKSTGIFSGIADWWKSTKAAIAGSPDAKSGGSASPQVGNNSLQSAPKGMDGGRDLQHPGKGTGGDINAIPKPNGNGTWKAVKDTILAAAKMVGVDGKLLGAMAGIESNFDYMVKAGKTSATGLFQFVSDTWNYMLKRHGAKYGIAAGTQPTDPRANALMGAEYLKESVATLEGKIGRQLTDTDVYMSHFLGPGGALKFLKADPNALGVNIMPDAAAKNRSIFYADGGKGGPMTVGQIYQLMNDRLQKRAKSIDVGGGGEQMVSSSTASQPMPAANGGSKADTPTAPTPTAPAPAGVGSAASTTPTASTPTASQPTAPTAVPMSTMMSGFVPQRSTADQVNAASKQNEVRVSNLRETNDLLEESRKIQADSFKVLGEIRDALKTRPQAAQAAQPADTSNTQPTPQPTRPQQRSSELPRAPVSVARPRAPF